METNVTKMTFRIAKWKYDWYLFHRIPLPKVFLCPRTQQQAVYKSLHPFLTSYAPISMPHTLINQAQNYKLLTLSLQHMLHNYVQKHV